MSAPYDYDPDGSLDVMERLMADDVPAFVSDLERYFGFRQSQEIVQALDRLMVPIPQSKDAYIQGSDGILIFSNEHAVVIRIELRDEVSAKSILDAGKKCLKKINGPHQIRIDDSPWVLRPLGSVMGEKYRIEIMPGVHFESNPERSRRVYRGMLAEGNHYWDARVDNIGRLPFPTPEFPDGMPVVIDRMAVERLCGRVEPVKMALYEMKCRLRQSGYAPSRVLSRVAVLNQKLADFAVATVFPSRQLPCLKADPQEKLYGPLKDAFSEACSQGGGLPDRKKMEKFWNEVRAAKAEKCLVAGWNDVIQPGMTVSGQNRKAAAARAAAAYHADKKRAEMSL